MRTVQRLAIVAFAALLQAAQPVPPTIDLDTGALARGPYSRMEMLLEKTIFSVDVLTVEVRFDPRAQQQFQKIAAGRQYSPELARQIADVAVNVEHVYASLEFERSVGLTRWVEGVRQSLETAWRAGLISEDSYRDVSGGLPRWFAVVAERGFERGDRILYRGYPDRLRTVLVAHDGRVLLDQTDNGEDPRRTLLAGYFAPGTDFREPLIRSLLTE